MQPKGSGRLDDFDRQRFKEMLGSEPFKLLMLRIQSEWERVAGVCMREDSELTLRRAQGSAIALAMVLKLPEQLLAEMKSPTR